MDFKGNHSKLHVELMEAFQHISKVRFQKMFQWSKGEFFALQVIHRHMERNQKEQGIYVSNMANQLHMAPSAVSRILKNLEKEGLIERSVDKKDRRNTFVTLTDTGKSEIKEAKDQMDLYSERVLKRMGTEETKQLIELCNKLANIMNEEITATAKTNHEVRKTGQKEGKINGQNF